MCVLKLSGSLGTATTVAAAIVATAALATAALPAGTSSKEFAPDPREVHFSTLHMLTDGAENAEAYFSGNGQHLLFQSNRPPYGCDQIYLMPTTGGTPQLISSGKGRTTCSYFIGDADRYIIYSTTALADAACPPPADMSKGYVWAVYPSYDIVRLDRVSGELVRLTDQPGYDAESTVGPDKRTIVFTSDRDGDLDVYTMDMDGKHVKRLTTTPGYDGGPFFSPDGKLICYRGFHPTDPQQLADYQNLLSRGLVRPTVMDIWVMNADGSDQRQVTHLNCASFGPYFHPSGKKIIFSSNYPDPHGREFNLWMVNVDGTGLEQITFADGFDGFPMWGPDGKTFAFCANRHDTKPGETNVFVTQWKE